jgi:prolyl oligopeptidase
MIDWRLRAGILSTIFISFQGSAIGGDAGKSLKYPEPPLSDTVENYHGTRVVDRFRPLEDPDAPATRAWVAAENKATFAFLDSISRRGAIHERLKELWDYEKYDPPLRQGGRFFFTYNTGLQNQKVLYSAESLESRPKVLLDPNTLSADGTVALAEHKVSEDGRYLAYGIAAAGSDWNEWKVRDVATGEDLPDHLKWIKFSEAEWSPDNRGFFYGRFPEPGHGGDLKEANFYQKVYYHRLGTLQADDRLIWEDPEHKEWRAVPKVSDDGKYLIFTIEKGTDDKHRVLYRPFDQPEAKPVHLVGDFDAEYAFIDNDGPVFWFKTNKGAPRGKVVAIDVRSPEPDHWVELIPEAREALQSVDAVADQLLASYLKDARTLVRVFDLKGRHVRDVDLAGLGTAAGFRGKRKDKDTFYGFNSFTSPMTIYHYDVAAGKSTLWRRPKLKFEPGDFETSQIFYTSKDGTRIPMFLSHKKGVVPNSANPTVLFGYGGFNIALTPTFKPEILAWMELGGLFAQPNLRGGGEYGEEWHQGGTKLKKQNVFDDFIAAAQWLITSRYTSTPKLAISGRSNGGLLVGACLTQRPDLYGAALPAVGVMDMLRFHKFTIGWAWVDDYGSSDRPDQFKALFAYSPLHNVKPGTCYPPTLITTADHDDRVVPAHSFKFAAQMQAAQSCDNPVLIRIETKAGHGAGKPTTKLIDEFADQWAFLVKVLGVEAK